MTKSTGLSYRNGGSIQHDRYLEALYLATSKTVVHYKLQPLDLETSKLLSLLSNIATVSALPVPKSRLTNDFHKNWSKFTKSL